MSIILGFFDFFNIKSKMNVSNVKNEYICKALAENVNYFWDFFIFLNIKLEINVSNLKETIFIKF